MPSPPVHDNLCAVADKRGVARHAFKAEVRTGCGAARSPSTGPVRASSTDARSRGSSPIKDVYSNRILGYSIDSRMKCSLAVTALNNAAGRRGEVADCVIHTDRGSRFRCRTCVHAINRHAMVESMGRVCAAGDNAVMESFALLQKNVLNRRAWDTREELRIALVTWIERTYHRRRRQAAPRTVDPGWIRVDRQAWRPPGGVAETVTDPCSSVIVGLDPGSRDAADLAADSQVVSTVEVCGDGRGCGRSRV